MRELKEKNLIRDKEFEKQTQFSKDILKAYKILGVKYGSSLKIVSKSYKEAVKAYHPDKYFNSSPEVKAKVMQKIEEINWAYNLLKRIK